MKTRLVKKRRRRVEWEIRRAQKRAMDCHDRWDAEVGAKNFFESLVRDSLNADIERLQEKVERIIDKRNLREIAAVHDS